MMKQTILRVSLVVAILTGFPGVLYAQGLMDAPSPLDEEGIDEPAGEPSDQEVISQSAKEYSETRRTVELPLEKKAKVVQKKLYPQNLRHELNLFFGVNPADSFVLSLIEGARYSFHINEMFAVQVVGGYMQSFDRDSTTLLTDDVDAGGLAIEPDFIKNSEIEGLVNADFVFYPVYGKFALLSSVILHYDAGIYAGAGVMFQDGGQPHVAPDVGLVANLYLLKWLSLRADFMYYAMITTDKRLQPTAESGADLGDQGQQAIGGNERGGTLVRHNYFITLGVSFHLPVD